MALLQDPTIQRILDEVNKAATGGVLGTAGNYISEPTEAMAQYESQLSSSANDFYHPDDAPLFYPTPDMLRMSDFMNFNPNLNFHSMAPNPAPSHLELYNTNPYDTMAHGFLSSYEHYNDLAKAGAKKAFVHRTSTHSTPSTLSASHEHFLDNQSQLDDASLNTVVPNLGLNIRATPPTEPLPLNVNELNQLQSTSEIKSVGTTDATEAAADATDDKEGSHLSSEMTNEDIHRAMDQHDLTSLDGAGQIFYDPNPQIIQRKGSHSVTYKQNIIVRFLQPPSIPSVGPLIIKEVRGPQTSPLPPLIIKQRPNPPKTPPPLIIREKPPPLPAGLATKVVTRQLPPEPAPPRTVIIERLPPLPPKPRDIIIERWLPYEIINQKRKVIVQRVQKSTKEQPKPKNIIITYEPVQAKIVRHFEKRNVTREDPQAYTTRYGTQLYDSNLVVQQARSVGVLEDLNPPASFVSKTSKSAEMDDDYASPATSPTTKRVDESDRGEDRAKINASMDEHDEYHRQHQQEVHEALSTAPALLDETLQDEDVLVEENVTPFYMNSGENLQQTLHRLGIDISENLISGDHF